MSRIKWWNPQTWQTSTQSSQTDTPPDQSDELPSFSDVQSRVFAVEGKAVYLGGEKMTPALRSLLRDQAKGLQTSQLWEVLNASVTNEAYNLALLQSQDFDSVRFAKAMHHWSHFMRNVIFQLAKD